MLFLLAAIRSGKVLLVEVVFHARYRAQRSESNVGPSLRQYSGVSATGISVAAQPVASSAAIKIIVFFTVGLRCSIGEPQFGLQEYEQPLAAYYPEPSVVIPNTSDCKGCERPRITLSR